MVNNFNLFDEEGLLTREAIDRISRGEKSKPINIAGIQFEDAEH